jgi:hypothetical protein
LLYLFFGITEGSFWKNSYVYYLKFVLLDIFKDIKKNYPGKHLNIKLALCLIIWLINLWISGNYYFIIIFIPMFYIFYTLYKNTIFKIIIIFELNIAISLNFKIFMFLLLLITSHLLNFFFFYIESSGIIVSNFPWKTAYYILPNNDTDTLLKTKLDVLNEMHKDLSNYDKDKLPNIYKKSFNFSYQENMSIFKPNNILYKRNLSPMHLDLPVQSEKSLEQNKEFLKNVDTSLVLYQNQKEKFDQIIKDIDAKKELWYPNAAKSLFNEYKELVPKLEKLYGDLGDNLEASIKKEDSTFNRGLNNNNSSKK